MSSYNENEIKCPECGGEMALDIFMVHFPRGVLPVEGLKCRICGKELITDKNIEKAEKIAAKLGLMENE